MNPISIKELGLILTTLSLGCLAAFAFTGALQKSFMDSLLTAVAVALAVVWTLVCAITLALGQRWPWVTPTVLVLGTMTTVIGAGRASWGSIGGGVLLGLFIGVARQAFRRDIDRSRLLRTRTIFNAGTRLLVAGVMVAAAGLALPFVEGKIAQSGIGLSTAQVELALRPLEPVLRQQGIDPSVRLPTGETATDVVTQRVNATLQNIAASNALIVALVAVVVAFLTLRAFIPAITWGILLLIAGGLWAGRMSGLIRVEKRVVQVETLTL